MNKQCNQQGINLQIQPAHVALCQKKKKVKQQVPYFSQRRQEYTMGQRQRLQ